MKNKRILSLFLVLTALFLTFGVNFASGATREATISTFAEKDTYVDLDNPLSNYGGKNWLIFGNYIFGFTEAYLFFDFSDKPLDWTKAEISIDMYSISETFDVSVSLINDSWSETGITWLNKPEHRDLIVTFSVSSGGIYKIDVTGYIEGRENISICINASDYFQNGYVQGSSREGYFFDENAPQLIWTYEETVEITVTSPDSSDTWLYDEHTITWNTIGDIDRVKIELYKDSEFIDELPILGYTENDGEYEWTIYSWDEYMGTNYRIKISDYDDDTVYGFSDYFEITETIPANNGEESLTISGYGLLILTTFGIGGLLAIIIAELRKFKFKN